MFYDTFKQLCDARGISCNKAALEIGLSNATPTKWKKTGATPSTETLKRIADYFGLTINDILGPGIHVVFEENAVNRHMGKTVSGIVQQALDGASPAKDTAVLNNRDQRDIARDLERIMADLESGGDLMFDGDPLSEEAKESIRSAMKLGLEAAKLKNKERFTPKKYQKD